MLILALLHAVPHEKHATATSALYAFRSTGSTLGLSAASGSFNRRLNQASLMTNSVCVEGDDCDLDALHQAFQLALAFACVVMWNEAMWDKVKWEKVMWDKSYDVIDDFSSFGEYREDTVPCST
ncbi:Major facilitator superfamily domain general substrate transporter [Penicillium odoratum]|uniref:Major facilitator superfamily domain general substrate transporter n=1 Tax=Penicillium odoratum TaxID=1167516 RepID=UPI0025495C2B|nr:Major facilitator superfamily domain general substrate transporter [Penicillium odoratum]KAJ5745785.1 Major facilitator superfamily domain general substrate transporter [Penicillium odoratum]